jgi:hypothetical protein
MHFWCSASSCAKDQNTQNGESNHLLTRKPFLTSSWHSPDLDTQNPTQPFLSLFLSICVHFKLGESVYYQMEATLSSVTYFHKRKDTVIPWWLQPKLYYFQKYWNFQKLPFRKNKFLWTKKKESLEYFEIFFNMKSSKLINYLADMCWSCPCIWVLLQAGSRRQAVPSAYSTVTCSNCALQVSNQSGA